MSNPKIDTSEIKKFFNIPERNKESCTPGFTWDNDSDDMPMVTIHGSNVEELFKERKINTRFYNFAWLHLFFNEHANFDEENIGFADSTLADIGNFLNEECNAQEAKDLARMIREDFRRQYIPTETLNWISSATRAIKWFKEKIITIDQDNIHRFINLNGMPLIQAIIDQWGVRSSFKVDFVSELRKRWEANIKSDHALRWLEEKPFAKERRDLAWYELCKKYGSKFKANNAPKTHQDILEIFDQLADEGISKKEFIRSLQLKQSKQKNVDNGRKPKNLDILLKNHSKLKELATIWEVTEREAMDRLISEAFEEEFGKGQPSEG
ncbi:hypothetical protein [Ectopseudomonas mendocina]|uniref:Uncharacterized protein n=1 Tax=Ectopseudomonas mendocina TaxID=300 RepID=A0A2R3QWB3_ECTME|nr:hypothetical protein [Pseudomonas mendocina]AVO56099.1 hypothetical protein C7A17_26270 [Pseudomonas mendocina]